MATAWSNKTVAQLLRDYAHTLTELKARGVIRSNNAPAGDYAEWLCAKALNGTIADNRAEKAFDLTLGTGETVQVKARVVSDPPSYSQLQTSPFRHWDFDHAALVLLRDTDYRVHRAVLLPVESVERLAYRVNYINGWKLRMTGEALDDPTATDITDRLLEAAKMPT